jgi:hypothetical protein
VVVWVGVVAVAVVVVFTGADVLVWAGAEVVVWAGIGALVVGSVALPHPMSNTDTIRIDKTQKIANLYAKCLISLTSYLSYFIVLYQSSNHETHLKESLNIAVFPIIKKVKNFSQ